MADKETVRMAGDYEIMQSFRMGGTTMLIGYNPGDATYMTCYQDYDFLGNERFSEAIGSESYVEIMDVFLQRLQEQTEKVRAFQAERAMPVTVLTRLYRTTRCPTCLTNSAHWTTIHFWRTNMKMKKPNTIARAVCAGVGVTLCCLVPVYATGGDPLTIVNNLSDFIFSIIKAIGIIILGWGIVQVGMSIQSHDASQRTQGLLCLFGGLLIAFAKEILTLIGAV